MGNAIDIGALADAIAKELSSYTVEVAEKVKEASDEVSKELLENTKRDAPKRTGDYEKAMRVKKTSETQFEKHNRWYVDPKTGEYRLSHLLENPHKKKNGGTTRAFPHIDANAEAAKEKFTERVKQAIENAK